MLHFLAELGVNLSIPDREGNTPLHLAVQSNQVFLARFLVSMGVELNAKNKDGNTPLHECVIASNIRNAKDLLLKGASRSAKNLAGQTPAQLTILLDTATAKTFGSVLERPWYAGCPLGRLPLKPLERNKWHYAFFLFLWFAIYLSQLCVIEPKLDVWYFMLSTSMIAGKLLISFFVTAHSKPGYLERGVGPEFEFANLLKKVPLNHLCSECKLIKAPRSKHCTICNRCVDRYEGHCVWLDNCVGRKNANLYFCFIFYVWLTVFLFGWIAMDSIGVTECEIDHCVYDSLCVGCHYMPLHYLTTVGGMVVCFFYFVPTSYLCTRQWINYAQNKTTNELHAQDGPKGKDVSDVASIYCDDVTTDDKGEELMGTNTRRASRLFSERPKRGCRANYRSMCCDKRVPTQVELLAQYSN